METLNYEDFSLGLHQRVVAQRIPLIGTIEVTRRCPLTCAHCYNNLPMADQGARRSELTYDEHCRILDEITEAGCLWLLYTGGEILARKDFLDIYTYAKQKGLIITLFTNGTLITPRVADYLVQWRPFSVEITLYGRTKETYERLTGIPGSYQRCLQGIRLLMERSLPVKLKTVAVTSNKHEIWDMKRFVEEPRTSLVQQSRQSRWSKPFICSILIQPRRERHCWRSHCRGQQQGRTGLR